MAKFTQIFKELREEKELSQEELSKKLGIHQKTISRWERGIQLPNIESLEVLARFFGVTAGYLIGMEED